jgi:hypothetical protein
MPNRPNKVDDKKKQELLNESVMLLIHDVLEAAGYRIEAHVNPRRAGTIDLFNGDAYIGTAHIEWGHDFRKAPTCDLCHVNNCQHMGWG